MSLTVIDYNEYNKTIIDWSKGARAEYLSSIRKSGVRRYSGELQRTFKRRTRKRDGKIYMVSFPFSKHGIWTWRGVGKGVPIALAGTPSTSRKPKDWISAPQEKNLNTLSVKIVPVYSGMIVKSFGTL
jgi:hypothetical protein